MTKLKNVIDGVNGKGFVIQDDEIELKAGNDSLEVFVWERDGQIKCNVDVVLPNSVKKVDPSTVNVEDCEVRVYNGTSERIYHSPTVNELVNAIVTA